MGATESVFSEEPSLSSSTTENPPPHPAVDAQLQQQILRQPPAPPLARGTTRTSEVSAVGRRSFSAASPAATSPSATTTATTTTQRSPPHSVFRLQGLVLGLEYSGKRTLLQRFEGKDPFSSSSSSTSTPRKTEILVPYKAPSPAAGAAAALQQQSHQTVAYATTTSTGAVVWDDRIQLHVRAATDVPTDEVVGSAARCSQQDKKGISSSSSSSSCSSGLDFAVLLLDPRQTQQHQQTKASSHSHGRGKEKKHPKRHRKLVKQHLESTIRSLLHLQGYTRQQDEQQLDEEGESSSSLPKTRRPLCLSILLNFRDLMGDDDGGNDVHFLQESDVTSLTMQVLQDYAHQLDSQQMVLQCSTISLQNCYGLGLLHYFIYQSYLQRKRHDTEVLLRSVRSLQHEAQLHAQSLLVSYSDFVAHTAANITPEQHAARKIKQQHQRAVEQQQQPAPSHSTSKRDETISSSRISTTKEGEMKSLDSVDEDDHDNHNVDIQLPNDRRRRVMPEPPPTQATKQQTKDALEAFLGSSSDEEDIVESVGKLQGNRIVGNRRAIQADTSDDDDDFFVEKESSLEEESNVEIAPTRRDGQYTALPTQQQQQQYERRTAAVAHERIKHDDSHAVASRSTERQQSAPPQLLQHERDVAEKEQHAASVDQGSNIPAPPLLSQEEKRRSHRSTTGNIVGTNPAYVEPTASRAASSSLTGNSTSDLEDEGATIKQQENNGVKNAHPAATTPAALLQQRQEPIESTPAPPPSSTSAEVSPTIQSLAPNDETTRQEVHREQSLPNSNETTATLSDAEHEDENNMHASRSSPEGKCDSVALNKNRGLERSDRETSEDTLDLRSDESLLAGSAATTVTQTGASMVADDESPHKTPVQLSINQQDDTDDDDDDSHFFIGSSTKRNDSSDADGDDDEFFISSSRYSNAAQAPPTIANHKASPPDSSTTTPPVGGIGNSSSTSSGSGGLSAEAREAIAKAQEAFERELYSSAIPEFSRSANQLGPVACDAAPLGSTGTIPIEQSDAGASSTSTGEGSKNHHKKEKKKKKEVKEKKKAEKKERKKVKHNGNV